MWLRVRKGCELNEGKRPNKSGDVFEIENERGERILKADPPVVERCEAPVAAPVVDKASGDAEPKSKGKVRK